MGIASKLARTMARKVASRPTKSKSQEFHLKKILQVYLKNKVQHRLKHKKLHKDKDVIKLAGQKVLLGVSVQHQLLEPPQLSLCTKRMHCSQPN